MSDDTNPMATLDLGSGKYTEMEWAVMATEAVAVDEVYEFRVVSGAGALDSYSVTPSWTVSSAEGSYSIGAASATYAWTVAAAGLTYYTPYKSMTASPASYTWTGSAASLTWSGGSAPITTYFNSLEPGGDGSDPNILLADDFSRGYWFLTYQSLNPTPLNAGWNGTPFGAPDPLGLDFGRAGQGIGGGTCVTNGGHTGIGQARAMGDHTLATPATEVYWRYYVKPLSGYTFGQEKALTFNKDPAGAGGIYFGTMFFNGGSGSSSVYPNFYAINQGVNLSQNQGNDLAITGGSNWYCIQVHLKLNGNGSDVVEMWIDNCGATGLSAPGSPTLRMRYTNASLRPGGDTSSQFGSIWLENWANPAAVGEMLYDQIMVSKAGPIGFAS